MRQQNRQAGAGNAQAGAGNQGQFGTEFAGETNAQQIRQQNQQAQARRDQNM
ncbi:gamma-type small acid-soluble spore protein [Bacillus sp. V33-4]|uniref:gamma-type small acid-soluble spore protein n=1 Tax=Bacillus sp. V33-4 TaxID=2054169 RepID=UPI003F8D43B3